jgi:hypothetical protein
MTAAQEKISVYASMSQMGELVKFMIGCWQEHVFQEKERTPEELLTVLEARPDWTERVKMFITHAAKTAFADMTAIEMLAGKLKVGKLETRGEDWLQDRTMADPLDKRVARVISEAKYWDWSLAHG